MRSRFVARPLPSLRLFPEWASFADFFHGLDHLADIFVHMGNVVLIQAPPEVRSGEELKQIRQ